MPRYSNEAGLEFTAASAAAVQAFDRTIHAYASFRRTVADCLKETLTFDPNMPMALVLKGCFMNYMGMKPLLAKAAQAAAAAEALAADATPRERAHIAALQAWTMGDYRSAIARWEGILREHPHDFLALKLANYLQFYLGEPVSMRDSVRRVLGSWDPRMPCYGYVRTLLAFGLEETGDYAEAEAIARQSLSADPLDIWAVHAVAHVMEAQGRYQEGERFLGEREADWDSGHNFRYHLWWHRALFHIGLRRFDAVLALYDERIWDPRSDEYLDLCNDASLLLRLELSGINVGARWQPLLQKIRNRRDEHIFAFVDAHFLLALAANRAPEAQLMLDSLRVLAANGRTATAEVTRDVGLALCEAIAAHRAGDYAKTVTWLAPRRERLQAIGGSHTQREVFQQLLADAATRSGVSLDATESASRL